MNSPQTIRAARDNPFAVHRVEACGFRFPSGDWPCNLERLEEMGYRATILGSHGAGKTSLMLELQERLETNGHSVLHVFVSRNAAERLVQCEAILSRSTKIIALVDGIERFNWWQRRNILRRVSAGLVVTVHRKWELPTWVHCQTSIPLLEELLQSLEISEQRLIQKAHKLFKLRKGNIREVFRDLFDTCAINPF